MSRFPSFFAIAVVLAMAGCTVHQDTVPSPTGPSDIAAPLADKPTPLFTVTPRPVTLKIPAIFDASASCPGSADSNKVCKASSSHSLSYAWSFGDGSTASTSQVSHTFTTVGTFRVTLTVTNDSGLSASLSEDELLVPTPPTAEFVLSPTAPISGEAVRFNASTSKAGPGRTITGYSWDFGDGTTGSGVITSHIFNVTRATTFKGVLVVTDDIGQQAFAPIEVAIGVPTTTTP